MRSSLTQLFSTLWVMLETAGFVPVKEFTLTDSTQYNDKMLAVVSFEGSDADPFAGPCCGALPVSFFPQ